MRFSLAKEHRDFFTKNGMIELEGLVNDAQLETLLSAITETFKAKLNISPRGRTHIEPRELFSAGHDLWRESPHIQKILFHRRLAEIATELEFRAPFRIGFDQFIPSEPIFSEPTSLEEFSYLQGVTCGFILCLKGMEADEDEMNPFPITPGNVVIFGPDFPIDFTLLNERRGCEYILMTYAQDKVVYRFNEKDSHTHFLKSLGYTFGDKLREATHPMVYRGGV